MLVSVSAPTVTPPWNSKAALLETAVVPVREPSAVLLWIFTVPAVTAKLPMKGFAPERTSVPIPALVREVPAPATMELMVSVALLTVIVEVAAMEIALPARTMAPEPEAKVMLPEPTVAEILIVPAPKPVEPLPKLMVSVVAVAMLLPLIAVPPVVSVLQPSVAVPAVGSAHVPDAVPKPAMPSLPSQ